MSFLLDEQLPPALVERLVSDGHEAEHINRVGLGGSSDTDVWRHCINVNATLMTKDADFLHLARSSGLAASVIWIRLGNVTTSALWEVLKIALPEIIAAIEGGERVVEVR